MSQPAAERSVEQVARERAMGEVSDVLLTVEHALDRARRALKMVRKDGADSNAELALADAVKELERVRKRLTQDTYFAGDALRML
jgi:predicted O-methyltransferase YrrM